MKGPESILCRRVSTKATKQHTHLQKQTQKNSLGFMGMMQSYTDELKAAQAGQDMEERFQDKEREHGFKDKVQTC